MSALSHHSGTSARVVLAQGFIPEDVKNLLGHSSIVLTSNTCGHVLEQWQRQVAIGMDAAAWHGAFPKRSYQRIPLISSCTNH